MSTPRQRYTCLCGAVTYFPIAVFSYPTLTGLSVIELRCKCGRSLHDCLREWVTRNMPAPLWRWRDLIRR